MVLPPIPWEPPPGIRAHRGASSQDQSAQCPGCPLWLGRIKDTGQWAAPVLGLSSPYLTSALAGEHEWKIVSTGITDCYFNVTELPPGSTAKFRVACVNKAGQGPYSNPSVKVHLEATGEQALSRGRGVACGLWGALRILESHSIFSPGLWEMRCHLKSSPSIPLSGSHLPFLPAGARAVPAKDVAVPIPEKVASSRSTQTPEEQQEPVAAEAPPTTPPRKHKGVVHKADGAEQEGAPTGVLPPPAPHEEGVPPDPELPPNITVYVPPELMFTPPRTVASPHTDTSTQGSPVPPTDTSPPPQTLSPSKSPTTSPVSTTPSSAPTRSPTPNTTPARKMPPYMVTSFISMPPTSPPALESTTTPPSSKEAPAAGGVPGAKDSTTLRQGVPQKPYTFLDEKAR